MGLVTDGRMGPRGVRVCDLGRYQIASVGEARNGVLLKSSSRLQL
jgi:hypothetical protein